MAGVLCAAAQERNDIRDATFLYLSARVVAREEKSRDDLYINFSILSDYPEEGVILSDEARREAHAGALDAHAQLRNRTGAGDVFLEFYREEWRSALSKDGFWTESAEAAEVAREYAPEDPEVLTNLGVAYHSLNRDQEAEDAYMDAIRFGATDPAVYANLSLIFEGRGQLQEAISSLERAVELRPDLEKYSARLATLRTAAAAGKAPPTSVKKERKPRTSAPTKSAKGGGISNRVTGDLESLSPADTEAEVQRKFSLLDDFKQRVLQVLAERDSFSDFQELSILSGVDEKFLRGHYRKLTEAGYVIELPGQRHQVDARLLPTLGILPAPGIRTQVIVPDGIGALKRIFNSEFERQAYFQITRIFPEQRVGPNVALTTIFDFERMHSLLTRSEFASYLSGHVDCCVISTATDCALIAFEFDSPFHDQPEVQAKDLIKNRIFQLGGVPLVRLRRDGVVGMDQIHDQIRALVGDLRDEIAAADRRAPRS